MHSQIILTTYVATAGEEGLPSQYVLHNAEYHFLFLNEKISGEKTLFMGSWSKDLTYFILNHPSFYILRSICISGH